LAHSHIVRAQ